MFRSLLSLVLAIALGAIDAAAQTQARSRAASGKCPGYSLERCPIGQRHHVQYRKVVVAGR